MYLTLNCHWANAVCMFFRFFPSLCRGLTILEAISVLLLCCLLIVVTVPVVLVQNGVIKPQAAHGTGKPLEDSAPIVVPPMPTLPKPTPPPITGLDSSGKIILEGRQETDKSGSIDSANKP